MKRQRMNRWIRTLAAHAMVLGGLAIVGCGGRGPDMVAAGDVALEKVDADGVRVTWAEVRPDATGTVVTGRVMPAGALTRRYAGHVDIEYVGADGKVVAKASSGTIHLANRGPGKGLKGENFRVGVEAVPPAGGTVRVTYHRSPHK